MQILKAVIFPWISTRLFLGLVALLSLKSNPAASLPTYIPYPWIECWFRWDSCFYVDILKVGGYTDTTRPFFPLLPCLASIAYWPLRYIFNPDLSAALACWLTSNLLFPLGLAGLFLWLQDCADQRTAYRGCWLMCLGPFSFFSCSTYSESLFLCLTCWSLYFLRKEQGFKACLLAGLAAVSRPPGIFFAASLGLNWLTRGPRRYRDLIVLCLPFCVFLLENWWNFGSPIAFVHAQAPWGGPISTRGELLFHRDEMKPASFATSSANFLGLLLAIGSLPLILWRGGTTAAIFVGLSVFVPGCRNLVSMARFTTYLGPLYLLPGLVLEGPNFILVGLLGLLLQGFFCWNFVAGNWVC